MRAAADGDDDGESNDRTPTRTAYSTEKRRYILPMFIVERCMPGMSPEHLAAAHRALAESARRLSPAGDRLRYLRSTLVPGRARCLFVFEATSEDLVRRVNEVAQVPFDSIDEAIELENPPL